MEEYQSFNNKTGRWVKYKKTKSGQCIITNVKQKMPRTPFKGVKKKQ